MMSTICSLAGVWIRVGPLPQGLACGCTGFPSNIIRTIRENLQAKNGIGADSAYRPRAVSIVVFKPKVRYQVLAHHVAERILELHQLDEKIVLRIKPGSRLRSFEIER